jgi:hypothetical protein
VVGGVVRLGRDAARLHGQSPDEHVVDRHAVGSATGRIVGSDPDVREGIDQIVANGRELGGLARRIEVTRQDDRPGKPLERGSYGRGLPPALIATDVREMGRRDPDVGDRSPDDAARLPMPGLGIAVAEAGKGVSVAGRLHEVVIGGAWQAHREPVAERVPGEDRVPPHRRTAGRWPRGARFWTWLSG